MQTFKNFIRLFVLIPFLCTTACNEPSTTPAEKDIDSSSTTITTIDTTSVPAYDPAKNLLAVGAPFSKKLHDSLGITIVEVTLQPGDSLAFHSDPDHIFYLLDSSKSLFYVPGQIKPDTLSGPPWAPGLGFIMGPFTEAFKNIGKTPLRWLKIYVHRPRGIEMPPKPAYDSAIDAFTLGGKSILKLHDTLGIKMFIVSMKPGDTATMHSHPDHAVYVLQGGEMTVTLQGGKQELMKLQKGMGFVGGPISDAAMNTGNTTIKLLFAHIYRPRID